MLRRCVSLTNLYSRSDRYPATAALTTGYVFRIENQATVFFLQRASQTAHLTTISVSPLPPQHWLLPDLLRSQVSITSQLLYHSAATLTLAAFAFLAAIADYWGVAILGILATARMLNFVVIRRRAARGMVWKGAAEPGVKGDLLILLSQDRWVRMQGLVDDLKAVTSGLWLADRSFAESSATAVSTVLVYAVAALATNVSQIGSIVLMVLLLGSAGALALANHHMTAFRMFGRELRVAGYRKRYERRRLLADDLISETGNREWALALGLIPASNGGENRAAVM